MEYKIGSLLTFILNDNNFILKINNEILNYEYKNIKFVTYKKPFGGIFNLLYFFLPITTLDPIYNLYHRIIIYDTDYKSKVILIKKRFNPIRLQKVLLIIKQKIEESQNENP